MALKLVADPKHAHRGETVVSISPARKRLTLYKEAREMMKAACGDDFDYVRLYVDPDLPDRFWIMPAKREDEGARKLDVSSPATRTLSITLLLQELNWVPKKTVRLPVRWDKENGAAVVAFARNE